ncbi:MAG: hypothetical protein J5920_01230 [Candidatus Methanomethylophilaceae archaeon]|nr:hypothetical protein [Candidatus Methanomethylophilaceae archaeon]MBR4685685.1 hypothetical protein [Candidatus Methanomethylophilaceae archaeon]
MVRFTLKNITRDFSIRMDMPGDESIMEIRDTVEDYWGETDIVLVKDYYLLDFEKTVGEELADGDLVEIIPDPSMLRTSLYQVSER